MPAALPVIAAFASGAAGAVIAGTATLVEFAVVAGAALSTIGAVTKNKDLTRLGAVVGLVGGVAGAVGGAATAGAEAAGSAAGEAAAGQAAQEAFRASEIAAQNATAQSAFTTAADTAANIAQQGATQATPATEALAITPTTSAQEAFRVSELATQPTGQTTSIMDAVTGIQTPGSNLAGDVSPAMDAGGRLGEAAQNFTSEDLASWWERAQTLGRGLGNFAKENKELVQLGLGAIQGMKGPEAEKLDYERSLYERARRNLNTPIALRYQPPRPNTGTGG